MTQSEFIKGFCERSKITEKELNKLGKFAVPCDCHDHQDNPSCDGWAMVSRDQIYDHFEFYKQEADNG